ncbi:MAG: GTPase HflX [Anaerolineae bacterium]|nr:GTPase HflX [Anaerolineae bacterium]
MTEKETVPTNPPREKAFLVGVDIQNENALLAIEDSLDELAMLADTAGLDVVGELFQRLQKPHPATFIGTGKVDEVIAMVEETGATVVLFDNELSPRHLRELEERIELKLGLGKVKVLDRTALILDIFALHANTSEGKLQVELAQYEYRLPRLTRAWTHLERQAGGGGGRTGSSGGVGLRGPGETQLESDRREILRMISALKADLEKVRGQRARYRKTRKAHRIPVVALVGYTNAGKSTLLNSLTDAGVYVADQLFATLDPTTRRVKLPNASEILITDTVGFIQKLPTQLVAAFRATLEEIAEADLLIHMVDISHPNAVAHYHSVIDTLKELQAESIPSITVLNKIDLLPAHPSKMNISPDFHRPIFISAAHKYGLENLLSEIENQLFKAYTDLTVLIPYQEGQLTSLFHTSGNIDDIQHLEDGIQITGQLPQHLLAQFQPYVIRIQQVNR